MWSWNIAGSQFLRSSTLGLGLRVLSWWCLFDYRYKLQLTSLYVPYNSWVNQMNFSAMQLHLILLRDWTMSTGEAIRVYQGHHKATVCCALHDGAESAPSSHKHRRTLYYVHSSDCLVSSIAVTWEHVATVMKLYTTISGVSFEVIWMLVFVKLF